VPCLSQMKTTAVSFSAWEQGWSHSELPLRGPTHRVSHKWFTAWHPRRWEWENVTRIHVNWWNIIRVTFTFAWIIDLYIRQVNRTQIYLKWNQQNRTAFLCSLTFPDAKRTLHKITVMMLIRTELNSSNSILYLFKYLLQLPEANLTGKGSLSN
jgi:hypothetical protein